MNKTLGVLGGAALIALGSMATYVIMRRQAEPLSRASAAVPASAPQSAGGAAAGKQDPAPGSTPSADSTFTLSKDAVARAGIVVARVEAASQGGRLRIPAVVEPNVYRVVVVTPIAAGRVTSVSAELGQSVRRGQSLAQVYSPELAEAQSRYLASRAELDAHERELRRTEKLVEIGSASRQELERIHAEHTAATTMVESLRSGLTLLGMTSAQMETLSSSAAITAIVAIPAPIDGVITARTANVGLNVDPSTPLFTVVDLSEVWLVGDLYERDFARVGVGSAATVTTNAYPEMVLEGKVSYIDSAINAQTRTARVRVEVPNPGRQLRLGMYAEMHVGRVEEGRVGESKESKESREARESTESRVVVPRAAVQIVGDRSVVYLADPNEPTRFVERVVQLGAAIGDTVEVIRGLQPGDPVVVKGSFSLRAERERLGLRPTAATAQPAPAATPSIRVTVSDKGFEPARVTARAGSPLRLTFVRTSDATCATAVTFPAFKITRDLPLNQPVDVQITPERSGDIEFACGMDMFRGTIVVQ